MDELNDAAARLRMIVRLLNRRAQADTGIGSPTRSEQAVLAWLEERGSMTLTALAAIEHVRLQSMGQTVDALEQQGRIVRSPHPSDRRQTLISITQAGTEALVRGREVRQAWLVEAIQTLLNNKEKQQLIRSIGLLERIVHYPAVERSEESHFVTHPHLARRTPAVPSSKN